jgi:glycosyltransferase involved in cell wall biosynthesis
MGKPKTLAFFAENNLHTSTAYFHVYVFISELKKLNYQVEVLGVLPDWLCPLWFRLKRRGDFLGKGVKRFFLSCLIPAWRFMQVVRVWVGGYDCIGMGRCMVEMSRVSWVEGLAGRLARRRGCPFVLFYPDALHLHLPEAYRRRFELATHVVAVTPWLAEEVKRLGYRSACVRAAVDVGRYPVREVVGERVTIGFSGGPGNAAALMEIGGVLAEVVRRRPGVRLKVVGKSTPKFEEEFEFEFRSWGNDDPFATPFEPGVEEMLDFDIGLAPIAVDDYALGKDSVKLRQYMALGLAVVGSDFGVNREVLRSWENGVLVGGMEGWIEAIVRLVDNPELRMQLGREARKDVEGLFDVAVQAPILAGKLDLFIKQAKCIL